MAFTFWPKNNPTLCRLHFADRLINPKEDEKNISVYVDVGLKPGISIIYSSHSNIEMKIFN